MRQNNNFFVLPAHQPDTQLDIDPGTERQEPITRQVLFKVKVGLLIRQCCQ